jgi:Tol biopolymer transport system component
VALRCSICPIVPPVWQPDGQFVLFYSGFTSGLAHIDRIRADGTGTRETVFKQDDFAYYPSSVCREGKYLAVTRRPRNLIEGGEPWILPLTGEQKPFALTHSRSMSTSSAFSPDCRWVAYISNETGQNEIYVTHFPDATHRYRVSTQGGSQPRWRGDGKELFYLSPTRNSIVAVSVDEKTNSISLGTPRTLFSLADYGAPLISTYDVTADGQRFLIAETNSPKSTVPLTLVTNWDAALKKR